MSFINQIKCAVRGLCAAALFVGSLEAIQFKCHYHLLPQALKGDKWEIKVVLDDVWVTEDERAGAWTPVDRDALCQWERIQLVVARQDGTELLVPDVRLTPLYARDGHVEGRGTVRDLLLLQHGARGVATIAGVQARQLSLERWDVLRAMPPQPIVPPQIVPAPLEVRSAPVPCDHLIDVDAIEPSLAPASDPSGNIFQMIAESTLL